MSTSGPNFLQTASCAELHGFVVFTLGPKTRNALTEHGLAESAAPCRKLLHGSAMFTLGPKASLLFDQWVCVKYVNWTDWGVWFVERSVGSQELRLSRTHSIISCPSPNWMILEDNKRLAELFQRSILHRTLGMKFIH